MPEMPEVEALRGYLADKLVGLSFATVRLAAISALKTFDPPLEALAGLEIERVNRHGKFIDIEAQGVHLVFHLARAGWLKWHEVVPTTPIKPGKGPLALRVMLDDDSGFDLTEAGTQKHLAVYVCLAATDVPGIAALGPDPLADDFDLDRFRAVLAGAGRTQLKGLLRDQKVFAGIGNAYSDEILWAARLSPFKPSNGLDDDELTRLFAAVREQLGGAIERARGLAANQLKDDKRSHLQVHGRTGEPCPACGARIAEVSFADSSLQYCPGCQTGGKPLADRRLSKLLK